VAMGQAEEAIGEAELGSTLEARQDASEGLRISRSGPQGWHPHLRWREVATRIGPKKSSRSWPKNFPWTPYSTMSSFPQRGRSLRCSVTTLPKRLRSWRLPAPTNLAGGLALPVTCPSILAPKPTCSRTREPRPSSSTRKSWTIAA
jgi:hypothetical protein